MGHVNFLVRRVCPVCLLRWRRKPDKLLTGWKHLWNTRRKPDRSIGNLGRTCWQDSVTFQNLAFQSPWEISGLWERKEGLRKASFQAMFRRKELKLLAGCEWFSHEWAEGHGLLLVLWQAETPLTGTSPVSHTQLCSPSHRLSAQLHVPGVLSADGIWGVCVKRNRTSPTQ